MQHTIGQPATSRLSPTVLVIGSGNAESILQLDGDLIIGQKHFVTHEDLLGGSGVNYTLRLLYYDSDICVLPILSVGDDLIGRQIQNEIVQAQMAGGDGDAVSFTYEQGFFCPDLSTPRSAIVITRDTHTILREEFSGVENFGPFVQIRMDDLDVLPNTNVDAVMIGHLYADRPDLSPGQGGEITRQIINRYHNHALVFTNFGESQYGLGCRFWESDLHKVAVFQLALQEARTFFAISSGDARTWSLTEMIAWFQERKITAVITLDRFGAVATFDGQPEVLFAPAFDLAQFVDATGAGDAFGAGLVSVLCCNGGKITSDCFYEALGQARIWSAYACTTRGGASYCPSRAELDAFRASLNAQHPELVESRPLADWESIFRILDKAY